LSEGTNTSKQVTQEIKLYTFHFNKKKIHLIDTPGFDDTFRTDTDVLKDLAYWLAKSYGNGFKLTGIIYLHPITATRMSGTAFKNLRTFRKLCGKQSMSSTVLATTMWANVTVDEGDIRETDLKDTAEFWGDMIREGSTTYRHTGDHHSAMNIISHLLNKHTTTVLGLQIEMVDQKKSLDDTEAGREVESEMLKERQLFERRLESTKAEMEEAIARNDKKHIEEIAKEQESFRSRIDSIQKGREELKISMEKLILEKELQHKKELAEIDKKLKERQAETEKSIKDFEEYKELTRRQQEQEDKKKAAIEAELDAAKEQAERSDAAGFLILQEAVNALTEQKQLAEAREKQLQEEMKANEARAAEAQAQQAALQRQQMEMMNQQFAQQQMTQRFALQQYAQQQQDQAMVNSIVGGTALTGLTGGALLGTALLAGCQIM
jgi:hypothetical protein